MSSATLNHPVVQAVLIALISAALLALARFFTTWRREFIEMRRDLRPLFAWWEKTSLDALKIATNPHYPRLKELSEKYRDAVVGEGTIRPEEKEELIEGLKELMADEALVAGKRSSASMALRFIEAREGRILMPSLAH